MEKSTDKRRRKLLVQPIAQMTTKLVVPQERHQRRKAPYYRIPFLLHWERGKV